MQTPRSMRGKGAGVASLCAVVALLLSGVSAQAQTYSGTRTSSFSYYGASDGVLNGLLKTEIIEPGTPNLCVSTTYVYDGYGNKAAATTTSCGGATGMALFTGRTSGAGFTASGTTQAITVGSSSVTVSVAPGLFAASSTNALGHTETKTYDPRFGAMLTLTGPNQLTTSWKLDDFGRVTKELRADGTYTLTAYCTLASSGLDTTANSNTGNGDPLSCPTPSGEVPSDAVMFVHSVPMDANNAVMGPFVRVYKDKLGRDLRAVTESFDGSAQASGKSGVAVFKDTAYDMYGVKVIETQAYFASSTSSTTTGSNDVGATKTVVDVLGRPTALYVADPNGQAGSQSFGSYGSRTTAKTTFSYAGLSVTTTNDRGQTRQEDKNALGELVRVTDATGATLIHQRDAFGNLAQTKDALGNITTLVYDIRGRKTQLQDPDTGTWKYAYDALGQLVWQQSPNQAAVTPAATQTTMVYDALGRLTSRTEPEYVSTWTYDRNADGSSCMNANANQGKGKLCQSSTSNGVSRQYVYDAVGRPSSSRTSVTNGPSFGSAVTYESATGRLASQTYPTGAQVGYSYTTRGYLEKLLLNTAATVSPLPNAQGQTAAGKTLSAGALLWQAQVVGAWGRTEQQRFGNGITNTAAFEAATGRITDLSAGPSDSVLAQHYVWDSLNNLTARSDNNGDGNTGAVSETFSYSDSLSRLSAYAVSASAIPGTTRTVALQYNALGMLLYKSDVGSYTYTSQGAGAGSKPHALRSIAGAVNASYSYDANGNLTTASSGKYRSVSYTSFNLPDSGSGLQGPSGSPKYAWQYDENHARIKETRTDASGTRTTWNLHPDNQGGLAFESETAPSGAISNRHYLSVGDQAIAVLVTTGQLPTLSTGQTAPTMLAGVNVVKLEFWHKDHLGSLITTTDHNGTVTARYAYDPFGKRRYANGTYDSFGTLIVDWSSTQNAGTDRGFTGHEHLDDVGVVHMNGRLFDPNLGIFMQADSLIKDPFNLQNYDRYVYCYNNPLTCIDPSGFQQRPPEQSLDGAPPGVDVGIKSYGPWSRTPGGSWVRDNERNDGGTRTEIVNKLPAGDLRSKGAPTADGLQGPDGRNTNGAGSGGTLQHLLSNAREYLQGFKSVLAGAQRSFGLFDSFVPPRGSYEQGVNQLLGPCYANCTERGILAESMVNTFSGAGQAVGETANRYYPLLAETALAEVAGELAVVARVAKEAGSIRGVNAVGGSMNCVNCVVATDATLAGRPASALGGGPFRIDTLEKLYGARFGAPGSIGSVSEALSTAGAGSRGIVFGSRGSGEVGHVFNAVNQNGVVRFLDGQTGRAASLEGYQSFQLLRTN